MFDLSSKVIDWLILETDGDWRSQVKTTLTGVKHDQVTYDDVSTCDCKEYLLFQDREILECTLPSRISWRLIVASPVTASRRRAAIRRRMPESLQPYSDTNWSSEMSFHFSAWNRKFTCWMLQKVLRRGRLLPRIARNSQEIYLLPSCGFMATQERRNNWQEMKAKKSPCCCCFCCDTIILNCTSKGRKKARNISSTIFSSLKCKKVAVNQWKQQW